MKKSLYHVYIWLDETRKIDIYVKATSVKHALKRAQKEYTLYNASSFQVAGT